MTYELEFKKSALKEWKKLGATVQTQFKKKLAEVIETPHIQSAKLSGANELYKIKLRQVGYRLVYEVNDEIITVTVISVGKRDKGNVYKVAMRRAN
ncbi:type II toxin-antitoxin system RelE family toxin [Colwellia hornerae]|uniref:Type II toxin-antitoxin system RelE/ParE family toxin n=1 Tax=Colwellia hornerae TaxID=89402 RepID=A0A5C6QMH8_9GAMM|nr:type II toxin-antitoxin system RelE/ParE family toxin [Colwellia hornerae]TWX53613.1 type II toxin-antitoxin system RelE/ParE family toxin [Colwellia hornerae]TWX60264.1 type II toxin-antitoxin system RelE/ParE family toxin [Colwellia hornerae]TWX70019.1 type II toxin-antitoxin system RelE/ParE family toxin [Colwellia hornerae]